MAAELCIEGASPQPRLRRVIRIWRRLRKNVGAMLGFTLLLSLVLVTLFAKVISPHDPLKIDLANQFRSPSRANPLGTDEVGRDVFSRVVAGARISMRVVAIVLLVAAIIGVPLGAISGFWGGAIDNVIMRLADIFLAFPSFILAMAIAASLGRSLENAMISVGLVSWPVYARLIRGQILSAKNELYVEAARAVGARQRRILFVHILPNTIGPLIVQLSMNAGTAILVTSGMSFVGIGAQPPTPEWGAMVANSRQFITSYWWIPTFPSIAISLTVAAYMFIGDGLRDLLDPRLNQQW